MCYKHQCHIVPPHILEALARQGSVSCKRTLNDTHRIIQNRNTTLNHLLMREVDEGEGDRFIYDSQNSYSQQVELVRKEGNPKTGDNSIDKAHGGSLEYQGSLLYGPSLPLCN